MAYSNHLFNMDFVSSWLRHYAASRKVEGSIPYEVNGFFISLPKPSHYGLGVDTGMFLGGKAQPVR
jgi:hypothetical protein